MKAIEYLRLPLSDENQAELSPMPDGMKLAGRAKPAILDFYNAMSAKGKEIADLEARSAASSTTAIKNKIVKEITLLEVKMMLLRCALMMEVLDEYPDIVGAEFGICPEGVWYHELQNCECRVCRLRRKAKELRAFLATEQRRGF